MKRLAWEAGYEADVLDAAEARFGFRFPPDLRELLLERKPVGDGLWDWHKADAAQWNRAQDWIANGIAFDVLYNGFWHSSIGTRLANLRNPPKLGSAQGEALVGAVSALHIRPWLDRSPTLIPFYGHRFMPSEPHRRGLPVLSVMQTDIVVYGRDLRNYVQVEFGQDIGERYAAPASVRPNLWADFTEPALA